MAMATASCSFSMLTFTDSSPSIPYASFPCRFATSHRTMCSYTNKVFNSKGKASSSSGKSREEVCQFQMEAVSRKRFNGKSNDEKPYSPPDVGRGEMGRSQSIAIKSFGMQRKDKKGFVYDLKEQQVNESGTIQDTAFLNAVVKVYCTHTAPDYSLPWQKQRQFTSTGRHALSSVAVNILGYSAFMIGDGKLLTNAHCVEHYTQVKVKRRGDDTKFVAKVLARGIECDIALLSVESEEFWKEAEPLSFGRLPCLQDAVTVVGYPFGGDTISVTKGVVSRIEVTSYAHGASELLGIQIDAAINPGNSGGPAFNDKGECIGVAFQVFRSEEAENIGYVIPTTVVSHFLNDYERNGKYTGFPSLGVLLQKLENPALRACLKVQSNERENRKRFVHACLISSVLRNTYGQLNLKCEYHRSVSAGHPNSHMVFLSTTSCALQGVLVRRIEPTSDANNVLKEGDVIVSFDGVHVGSEGTVPFRSSERIAFRYLISQKFAGDVAELGIIREGAFMKVQTVLNPRVHLVPYHIEGGQPSYLIIAGLVFTPLSEPLIDEECEDTIGLKLLVKARYSLAKFKGEEIVILSQVLKFNGTRIKNIRHLAHLLDSCKNKYLVFEFEDNFLAVLEREAAAAASSCILKGYGIPSERSSDLLEPYDLSEDNQAINQDLSDSPVSNLELGFDGLLWA
ncbi:hypothetical protein HHK36_020711 [Tetracentron sinense]|uniref:Protease Do-like PDZ domain-containing protein n=1 Tax=Tetracentron sinense TaxID=13715 RepID=A0A835D935_TETSI|nr:hypothetical protein HHK36_020711 [Tetracentron sinense]